MNHTITVSTSEEQLKYHQTITHRLNEIGKEAARLTDKSELLQVIVASIARSGFDRVRLARFMHNGKSAEIINHVGHHASIDWANMRWCMESADFDLTSPHPKLIIEPDCVATEFFAKVQPGIIYRQRVEFPLVIETELIGVISADVAQSGRKIQPFELKPLMNIAHQAAIHVHHINQTKKRLQKPLRLQLILDAAVRISKLKTTKEIYEAVPKAIMDSFPEIDRSALVLFEPDMTRGKMVSEHPRTKFYDQTIPLVNTVLEKLVKLNDLHFFVHDTANWPELRHKTTVLSQLSVKSILVVLIKHDDQLLGTLTLETLERSCRLEREDIQLMEIFAMYVGAAMNSAARVQQVNLLNEATRKIGERIDRHRHLQEIIALAVKLLGARSGGLTIQSRTQRGLDVIAGGKLAGEQDIFLPEGTGMVGVILAEQLPVLQTPDYSREKYAADVRNSQDNPQRAVLQVPYFWEGKAVGTLYVNDVVGRKFYRQDIENLQILASYATSIINLANLVEQRTGLANTLDALNFVGDAIEATNQLAKIAHFALFGLTASYALNCEQAILLLCDNPNNPKYLRGFAAHGYRDAQTHNKQKQRLRQAGVSDFANHRIHYKQHGFPKTDLDEQAAAIEIDLSDENVQGLRYWLADTAKQSSTPTVFTNDEFVVPKQLEHLIKRGKHAAIMALVTGNQQIGIIFVQNPFSRKKFGDSHQRALHSFASTIAVAITKLRLLEKTKRDAARFQRLFELGSRHTLDRDRKVLIQDILRQIMEDAGAQGATFVRINEKSQQIKSIFNVGLYEEENFSETNIRKYGNSMHVMQMNVALPVPDSTTAELTLNKSVNDWGIQSLVCLPARAIDETLGVIWLGFLKARAFDHSEINAWQLFADHAAMTYRLVSDIQRLESERTLTEGATEILTSESPADLHDHIVRNSLHLLRASCVSLYVYDHLRDTVTSVIEALDGGKVTRRNSASTIEQNAVRKILASTNNNIQFVSRFEQKSSGITKTLLPGSIKYGAAFFTPLHEAGIKFGLLAVGYEHNEDFSQTRRAANYRLQRFCSLTFHNLARMTEANNQVTRLKAMGNISWFKNEPKELNEIFDFVTQEVYAAFEKQGKPIRFCEIRLRDANDLVVESVFPRFDENQLKIEKRSNINLLKGHNNEPTVVGQAFLSGETQHLADVNQHENYESTLVGIRSEVAVPLKWQGHILGVLNVEHDLIKAFTDDDIAMLESTAAQVASVLMRKRQRAQRASFHKVAKQIAASVTDIEDSPNVLEYIHEHMSPIKGTTIKLATLHDVQNDEILIQQTYPRHWLEAWQGLSIDIRQLNNDDSGQRIGITGRCARMGAAQIVPDVSSDSDYIKMNPTTKSELAVPVYFDGTLFAVLAVQSEQLDAFTKADRELLETFAELAVIAVNNGRRVVDLTKMNTQLNDMRRRVDGATALALLHMISGVYQHANRSHALTIRDRLELLRLDYTDSQDLWEHIEEMDTAVMRIIDQPLTSNVTDMESAVPLRLSHLLQEYFNPHNRQNALGNVQCELQCSGDRFALVRGHKEWILQLFELIARNTRHALRHVDYQPVLRIELRVAADQHVHLHFIDNGPGIPDAILEQVFIKPIRKNHREQGLGIGLLMARLIVESYGGNISADNIRNGEGAIFRIVLPIDID